MLNILNNVKCNIVKSYKLFIVSISAYILGIILGLLLPSTELNSSLFLSYAENYFLKILCLDASVFSNFFSRVVTIVLLFLFLLLISTNRYTLYLSLFIVFYRGLIIGYSFIAFVLSLGFNGIVTYLFVILIQNIIITFAIVVYVINAKTVLENCKNNIISYLFNYLIISLIISFAGAIIEFLLVLCVFRPLNLYF